jgi:hypothetical protein
MLVIFDVMAVVVISRDLGTPPFFGVFLTMLFVATGRSYVCSDSCILFRVTAGLLPGHVGCGWTPG